MHTIYSYGGGEYLFYIFNFVAMLVKKDGGGISTNIIRMVAIMGVVWSIVLMYMRNSILPGATWLLWFMIASFIVVGPKETVYIKDPIAFGGIVKHVDNVPLILVLGASTFSAIGHSLTASMESTFIVPGGAAYLTYIETGSLFGSKVIKKLQDIRVEDPIFHANLDRFVQQCVVYDAMIGRKYTLRDLRNTNDIWTLVSTHASPVLGFLYKDAALNEIVTCAAGVALLNTKWNAETDSVALKQGKNLFGMKKAGDPGYAAQSAKNLFLSKFPQSYMLFSGLAASATDLLKQQMMIDVLRDAPAKKASQLGDSYALAKASLEQRNAYQISGLMAEESLVVMRAVFEALLYGAFIFVYILIFLPGGYRVLGYYFQALCWIQLWAPLYAILNFIMTLYGHYRSVPLLGGIGLSRANSAALIDLHADITALAGWLSLSVPYLSYMLINKGGVAAFVGIANSINSSMTSAVANAAAERTTGNISLGNFSQGNISMQNMSAYKYNDNADFQSGQFSKNLDTGAMQITNQDGVVILAGQGRTVSTFSTEVVDSQHLSMQLNKQSQREKSIMNDQSIDYSKQVTNTTRDLAELASRLTNGKINSTNYSNDQSFSESKALTNAVDFSEKLQKKFGFSASVAFETAAGISAFGSGAQFKTTTGMTVGIDQIRDFATSEGYRESLDSVVRSAKNLNFNDQQSKEKVLVEQISSSYETGNTLRESILTHQQNSERLGHAASIAESSNFDVRTIMTQELFNFIANSPGVNSNSKIGSETAASIVDATSGPLADRKQEFLDRFQENRTKQAIEYFTKHEIKTEADLNNALQEINADILTKKPELNHSIVLNNDDAQLIKFDDKHQDKITNELKKAEGNFEKKTINESGLRASLEEQKKQSSLTPENLSSHAGRTKEMQRMRRVAKYKEQQENKQLQE